VESHPKIEEPAPGGSSRSYSLAVEAEARLESARGAADLVRREISALRKRRDKLRAADAGDSLRNLAQGGETVDGHKVVAGRVEAAGMEEMKNYGDRMRAALGSGVALLGAVSGGKVLLVCVVTDDLAVPGGLDAGKIVREAAAIVGGSGGGRPGMATAGGKDPGKLPEALDRLPSIVRGMLVAK
jgi:alanyl-tRNA synthetase